MLVLTEQRLTARALASALVTRRLSFRLVWILAADVKPKRLVVHGRACEHEAKAEQLQRVEGAAAKSEVDQP